jgi:kynurenine 3-monooxygenase
MKTDKKSDISIIGAGLAGCFLAIMFARRGNRVHVYEKHAKNDIATNQSIRSFNLTFYRYCTELIKEAGLWKAIEPILIPLQGSYTQVTKNGKPIFAEYDPENMPYYTVQRAKILSTLIREAQKFANVTFHFDTSILSVDRQKKTLVLQNERTNRVSVKKTDIVIGADGVNSTVRSYLQPGQETDHRQEYIDWTYKQIVLTKEDVKNLQLNTTCMHAWTREDAIFLSFPAGDGSYSSILVLPKDKKKGFDVLTTEKKIKMFVEESFPALKIVTPSITDAILNNPEGSFVSIYTSPWYYKDFMVIIGDAAHGFLPFCGQGMSTAFSDCRALMKLVDKYEGQWEKIFALYQDVRKQNTDVIADLSKECFKIFRRHTRGDYAAVYDRLESELHRKFPNLVIPSLYNLVAGDLDHAAAHKARHMSQRKKARFIGIPVAVCIVAGGTQVYDLLKKSIRS